MLSIFRMISSIPSPTEEQYGRVPCGDIGKRKKPLHVILALEKDRQLATIMQEERVDGKYRNRICTGADKGLWRSR